MQVLGANVVPISHGSRSLREAVDSAFSVYAANPADMFFAIGSTVGPHPYPMIVRDFQAVVGYEAKQQFAELTDGDLPDQLIACIGGGCNSIALMTAFLDDKEVKMIGVEPEGRGLGSGQHAATLTYGKLGVIHGMQCYTLMDEMGNTSTVHSIASGLSYPGVGPQHSYLKDAGRVVYETVTDDEATAAFFELSRTEGIIPALESSHALAYAIKSAPDLPPTTRILVNLSGRGEKDLDYICDKHGEAYGIRTDGVFAGPSLGG